MRGEHGLDILPQDVVISLGWQPKARRLPNTLMTKHIGTRLPDSIFEMRFPENYFGVLIQMSLKYVPQAPIEINQHWFWLWLDAEQATLNEAKSLG